jgi:D-3-phosphoglycerate dehydrogenase
MAINRKQLAYFERWFDPIAEQILGAQDDIELVRLHYKDPEDDNWSALKTVCGYQVSARTELRNPGWAIPACWSAARTCWRCLQPALAMT